MILSAVVTLLSSQVQVYVVDGVQPNVVERSEYCAKAKCLDGSDVYRQFFPSIGVVRTTDFQAFTAGPFKGWPTSLDGKWRELVAKCRALAGPPPWKTTAVQAIGCAEETANELWGAWLSEQKATRVAIFSTTKKETKWVVSLTAFEFPATKRVRDEVVLDDAKSEAAVMKLAKRAQSLESATEAYVFPPKTEAAGVVSAFNEQPVATGAVPGVRTCEGAPGLLEVSGLEPLAKSVSTRWAASKIGGGAGRKCTLSETRRNESAVMPMTVITATLTCGETSVATELATIAKTPVENMSAKLVKSLSERLCR